MHLTTDDDGDCCDCPHCGVSLSGFEDDVSDADYCDDERDIASITCPACRKTMALVRTHNYRLAKFATPDAAKND